MPSTPCIISCDVRSALIKDKDYNVKPFIQTEKRTVYGPQVTFRSLGSNAPVIKGYYPHIAHWQDTVRITGKNFPNKLDDISIKLGNVACLVSSGTDTAVSFVVSSYISTLKSILSINVNGSPAFSLSDTFKLKAPVFSFAPKQGKWRDTVILEGRFNSISSRNKVFFNSTPATIASVSDHQIVVSVPYTLPDSSSVIKYLADPFNIVSSDSFRIKRPIISSFYPIYGTSGANMTIKGSNFNSTSAAVYFGNIQANLLNINDTTLVVTAPSLPDGSSKITVKIFSQKVTSSGVFTTLNPVISVVSPLSGTFGDSVTITGSNFISPTVSTTVSFSGIQANIVSITGTQIVVLVPTDYDSIPRPLVVTSGNSTATSSDKFILNPLDILSISPLTFIPGGDFIVTGHNFDPVAALNQLYWGEFPIPIKSATANQIVGTWPLGLTRGTEGIKVISGGYSRLSSDKIEVLTPWKRIQAPLINTYYSGLTLQGAFNFGTAIGNNGYILSSSMDATYKFDPTTGIWSSFGPYPSLKWILTTYAASAVLNDTIYVIGGYSHDPGISLTSYNINTNYGRYIGSSPDYEGVAFGLNNKLYFGLDIRNGFNKFWELDPMHYYSFVEKGDFPIKMPGYYASYFTLNNKGYMVLANNQVWEFDPDLLQWSRKSDFPGPSRKLAVSFCVNGILYFGTGINAGTLYKDIWKYDPNADSWTYVTDMYYPRHTATAFSINGKGYIGFGSSGVNSGNLYDFYEFDPSYFVK